MRLKNKLLTAGCMAAAAAMLLSNVSCNDHELEPFSQSLSAGQKQTLSSGSTRPVDILFVVDNSNSMTEEQLGLDQNFRTFLAQLATAGADYRLAAVTTQDVKSANPFKVSAPWDGQGKARSGVADALPGVDMANLKTICNNYFGSTRAWISSSDLVDAQGNVGTGTSLGSSSNMDLLVNLFRCEAIGGTDGDAIERGLANMSHAFQYSDFGSFKRDGSILAIVFVTDENDCTETNAGSIDQDHATQCELQRNIEDSCIISKYDRVVSSKIKVSSGEENVSSLQTAEGQLVSITDENGNEMKEVTDDNGNRYAVGNHTLRELCVKGDDAARAILSACVKNEDRCSVSQYIDCPDGVCTNGLKSRYDFYQEVINVVVRTNRSMYEQNKSIYDNATSDAEKQEILNQLAKQDVIVANIINRDEGKRYTTNFNDRWCAGFGSQGYRYQWFAEMFENDPIFAPICCQKNRQSFMTSYKEADAGGRLETKVGPVCEQVDVEINSQFGPVLGAIGQRIGEAVNTVCTDSAPVTCIPDDCNGDKPNANCPCNHGCSETSFLKQSDHEYHLCNEFDLKVGVVDSNITDPDKIAENYKPYKVDDEYSVNFESEYCMTRTGSPIQINLNKNEPNTSLVIEYPKKVSSL